VPGDSVMIEGLIAAVAFRRLTGQSYALWLARRYPAGARWIDPGSSLELPG